jgi:hypothetical protein
MSDPVAAVSSPASPGAPQTKPTPPKKGRWRRRIIRGLVAIIVLAFVLRVTLFFLLRPTLARVSQAYGIDITLIGRSSRCSAATSDCGA